MTPFERGILLLMAIAIVVQVFATLEGPMTSFERGTLLLMAIAIVVQVFDAWLAKKK